MDQKEKRCDFGLLHNLVLPPYVVKYNYQSMLNATKKGQRSILSLIKTCFFLLQTLVYVS